MSRREFAKCADSVASIATGLSSIPATQATTFRASDRRCATCDFWGGQHNAAADKASVTVADGATGFGDNTQGPLFDRQARSNQIFNNGYRRWRDLR
jgi:hypothetical protein